MPERRVLNAAGITHFVTFSTYQRRQFLSPERTRSIVVEVLQSCLERHCAGCHGFVIMPNHVHALLVLSPELTIGEFLLAWKKTSSYRVKRFYKQEFDRYHKLCPKDCPIWQANYYDHALEKLEHINSKIDYMHSNPVEKQLALTAIDWRWSSARFYELQEYVGVPITVPF